MFSFLTRLSLAWNDRAIHGYNVDSKHSKHLNKKKENLWVKHISILMIILRRMCFDRLSCRQDL